jgi:hypothetical protein
MATVRTAQNVFRFSMNDGFDLQLGISGIGIYREKAQLVLASQLCSHCCFRISEATTQTLEAALVFQR